MTEYFHDEMQETSTAFRAGLAWRVLLPMAVLHFKGVLSHSWWLVKGAWLFSQLLRKPYSRRNLETPLDLNLTVRYVHLYPEMSPGTAAAISMAKQELEIMRCLPLAVLEAFKMWWRFVQNNQQLWFVFHVFVLLRVLQHEVPSLPNHQFFRGILAVISTIPGGPLFVTSTYCYMVLFDALVGGAIVGRVSGLCWKFVSSGVCDFTVFVFLLVLPCVVFRQEWLQPQPDSVATFLSDYQCWLWHLLGIQFVMYMRSQARLSSCSQAVRRAYHLGRVAAAQVLLLAFMVLNWCAFLRQVNVHVHAGVQKSVADSYDQQGFVPWTRIAMLLLGPSWGNHACLQHYVLVQLYVRFSDPVDVIRSYGEAKVCIKWLFKLQPADGAQNRLKARMAAPLICSAYVLSLVALNARTIFAVYDAYAYFSSWVDGVMWAGLAVVALYTVLSCPPVLRELYCLAQLTSSMLVLSIVLCMAVASLARAVCKAAAACVRMPLKAAAFCVRMPLKAAALCVRMPLKAAAVCTHILPQAAAVCVRILLKGPTTLAGLCASVLSKQLKAASNAGRNAAAAARPVSNAAQGMPPAGRNMDSIVHKGKAMRKPAKQVPPAAAESASITKPAVAADVGVLQDCVVCLDAPRSVALLPCGHVVLCSSCFGQLHRQAQGKGCGGTFCCPLCRTEVQSHVGSLIWA